jgi:hypothetical protein
MRPREQTFVPALTLQRQAARGFMATPATVSATGDEDIDGLLYGRKWTGTVT